MWQLLEPYHAAVYFDPEAKSILESTGLKGGWMGYFASRSAALGPVPAEVVVATFYNFHPRMVRRALPDAWRFSSPEKVLAARNKVADVALTRLLGDEVHSPTIQESADLTRRAALACDSRGRPLFAAHAALAWPPEPHLALWHAATLLREFRGDGHVAVLVANEIDGCEAHVLLAGAGVVPAEMQREYRGWSQEEWGEAATRLNRRGLVDATGKLTERGQALHARIEATTDELAVPPFRALGEEGCLRLEHLLETIRSRILEEGGVPYPNPMGLTKGPAA